MKTSQRGYIKLLKIWEEQRVKQDRNRAKNLGRLNIKEFKTREFLNSIQYCVH